MDPIEVLKNIRAAIAELRAPNETEMDRWDAVDQMVDSFEALDKWMRGGGFSPWGERGLGIMTQAQREALSNLCARYHVAFNESDYTPQFDLPVGYVAGWVGGTLHASRHERHGECTGYPTIYVGCDSEGRISS